MGYEEKAQYMHSKEKGKSMIRISWLSAQPWLSSSPLPILLAAARGRGQSHHKRGGCWSQAS